MALIELCLCLVLRQGPAGKQEILLGHKLRGFGKGRLVGPGGHIEPGESPAEAVAREVAEETGLIVLASDLKPAAIVTFRFPADPPSNCRVHVFLAQRWSGTVTASDELFAQWWDATTPPLVHMWDDNHYWLPPVLKGEYFEGEFFYSTDGNTVEHFTRTR